MFRITAALIRSASSAGTPLDGQDAQRSGEPSRVQAARHAAEDRRLEQPPVHPAPRGLVAQRARDAEDREHDHADDHEPPMLDQPRERDQRRVRNGSCWPVVSNTPTTFGTTYTSISDDDEERDAGQHDRIDHRLRDLLLQRVPRLRCTPRAARAPCRVGRPARRRTPWRGRPPGTRAGSPRARRRACGLRSPWRARRG